jgi:hypothetical protein
MAKKFSFGLLFILLLALGLSFLFAEVPIKGSAQDLESQSEEKFKILIFAGHEPEYGGAEYKGVLERDLNLQLAEELRDLLANNSNFEVAMVRDRDGWNPVIKTYVSDNKEEIKTWLSAKKEEFFLAIKEGKITPVRAEMGHRETPLDAAIFMYGVNKWAGENDVDLTLHLHFNNNPKYKGKPNYEGFAIYIPEKQYQNFHSSRAVAESLMVEIAKVQKVSTMKAESEGIIEDQELIAVGCYNTALSPAVVVEYAYIYEDLMLTQDSRDKFITQMASSTAQALENHFIVRY